MLKKIVFGAMAVAVGYFAAATQSATTLAKLRAVDEAELEEKLHQAQNESFDDGVEHASHRVEKKHIEELKKVRQDGYVDGFNTSAEEAAARSKLLKTAHETEVANIQREAEREIEKCRGDLAAAANVTRDLVVKHEKNLAKVRAEAYNKGREDALKDENVIKEAYEKGRKDALAEYAQKGSSPDPD